MIVGRLRSCRPRRSTAVYCTVLRSRGVPRVSTVNCVSVDLDRTRPLWRQIAAIVVSRMADGTYPVGTRVPSVVEISTEFEVAASTAQKVLAHLKAQGLIRTEVGLGSFVTILAQTPDSRTADGPGLWNHVRTFS